MDLDEGEWIDIYDVSQWNDLRFTMDRRTKINLYLQENTVIPFSFNILALEIFTVDNYTVTFAMKSTVKKIACIGAMQDCSNIVYEEFEAKCEYSSKDDDFGPSDVEFDCNMLNNDPGFVCKKLTIYGAVLPKGIPCLCATECITLSSCTFEDGIIPKINTVELYIKYTEFDVNSQRYENIDDMRILSLTNIPDQLRLIECTPNVKFHYLTDLMIKKFNSPIKRLSVSSSAHFTSGPQIKNYNNVLRAQDISTRRLPLDSNTVDYIRQFTSSHLTPLHNTGRGGSSKKKKTNSKNKKTKSKKISKNKKKPTRKINRKMKKRLP